MEVMAEYGSNEWRHNHAHILATHAVLAVDAFYQHAI